MADPSALFSGSGPVRAEHRFDEARLERWLGETIPDYSGPLRVEQFAGGQSNPTFRLVTGNRAYVLRRKPAGVLLKGAHAVDREARVIGALGEAGFPVPKLYGLCTDDSVIGSWFYVMEMVEGRIFWQSAFPQLPQAERVACFDAMNDTIARLHRIDPISAGLADYGRPEGFLSRQVARWIRQYRDDPQAGRLADMDMLCEWLPANLPEEQGAAIFHGDFRVDNMIFHPTEPRIVAVLDWELSTLGDPLADFTFHMMMYRLPPAIGGGLEGFDLPALGLPTEEDYLARYCRRTGRERIGHLDFYVAYNMFRLASIIHGIKGRHLRGTASSGNPGEIVDALPLLAARARQQVERAQAV
ncbi:aminoglycoside phosphotransferase [Sphingobium jiangsuense]|uniref:Aminoglycoside phosphotransferase (APT) family kinase protein n=1 Tax=Sphingobium jiangsuense TaxID=870476 RepID=A0A7W6BIV0_9SPHN|nr:phosphotransferase family protein [Sphingobium jiangsuense]MBB3925772.1 aminoglycoside phosphotransferase (APT) family kinase protein [Sphingobium jiangsuense]GLT02589.1 aminoglycoside phosphotransferase [Sphingobium jiangsuense]